MEAPRSAGEDPQGAQGEGDPVAERRAREEAEAAAREAAGIGGPGSPGPDDEAERPLAEAGGGEAEGFEQAERDLVEHASHGDPAPDPTEAAIPPEPEPDDAERGAADHEHSSQRRDDRQIG